MNLNWELFTRIACGLTDILINKNIYKVRKVKDNMKIMNFRCGATFQSSVFSENKNKIVLILSSS